MKIHWMYKLAVFVASVMTLSWFFAGYRQVQESSTLGNWALLLGGTLATVLLLGLQGYWIYFEEKSKGSLKKQIPLFEKIQQRVSRGTVSACGGESRKA